MTPSAWRGGDHCCREQSSRRPASSVPAVTRRRRTADRPRSEERRVGKECVSTCRSRWSPSHYKNKKHITKFPDQCKKRYRNNSSSRLTSLTLTQMTTEYNSTKEL